VAGVGINFFPVSTWGTPGNNFSPYLDTKNTSADEIQSRSWLWQTASSLFIGAALIIGLVTYAPEIYYWFAPVQRVSVSAQEIGTVRGGEYQDGPIATREQLAQEANTPTRYLPEQNTDLPKGEWLIIPKIGVRTQYIKTELEENPDEALSKGVWFVPGYGEPGDLTMPTIMAAHRYPFDWMYKNDYWQYHTFHLLPDLEPGDTIEVIQDQRKFTYEIYAGEESDELTDYDADLILYTCKFLNSPVRHVRYARLIQS